MGRTNDAPNMKNMPIRVCFSCLEGEWMGGRPRNAPNMKSMSIGCAFCVGIGTKNMFEGGEGHIDDEHKNHVHKDMVFVCWSSCWRVGWVGS